MCTYKYMYIYMCMCERMYTYIIQKAGILQRSILACRIFLIFLELLSFLSELRIERFLSLLKSS